MGSVYSRGQTGNTQAQSAPYVITLTMRRGPEPGRKFVISKERVTLGRLPTAEVSIEHRQVSARHASIVREKDRFVLSDLGSANGTTVNDARLTGTCLLRNGDIIGLGDVELLFQVSGGASAAAGPQPTTGAQAVMGPPPRPVDWHRPLVTSPGAVKAAARPRWPVFVVAGCAVLAVIICLAAAVAFFTVRQLPVFAAAPELTVIGPTGGIEVRAGQPVRVVASAKDPRGVTKAEVWVRGELDSTIESDVPGGQRLLRVEQPWTPSGAGDYDIQIKVYNSAGKMSESQPIPITVLEDQASQPTVIVLAATATPAW